MLMNNPVFGKFKSNKKEGRIIWCQNQIITQQNFYFINNRNEKSKAGHE